MGTGKRRPADMPPPWHVSDPRTLRSSPRLSYAVHANGPNDVFRAVGIGISAFVLVAGMAVGTYLLRAPATEPSASAAVASYRDTAVWPEAAEPSHIGVVQSVIDQALAQPAAVLNELVPVARVVPVELGDGLPSDIPYQVAMQSRGTGDDAEFTSRAATSARAGRPTSTSTPAPTATATVAPTPSPRPTPSREIRKYVVQEGDTLNGIAEKFGITVATLMKANNIEDSEKIMPGDVLIILPVSGVIYEVEEGDTVVTLAEKFGVTPEDIIAANGLTNPDFLLKGTKLIIPEIVHRQQAGDIVPEKHYEPLEIHKYTVVEGDSVAGIAEKFGINLDTLLWANEGLKATSTIHPGDVLIVPPVDGVLHTVGPDDTVFDIAARYGAGALAIVEANGLKEPYVILPGQVLIVPGGSPSGQPIQPAAPTAKPAGNAPRPVATQRPQPAPTAKPAPKPAAAPTPKPAPPPPPPKPSTPANSTAANVALQYRGWAYVWGGTSPSSGGFDCSGLTWFAYRQAGKPIPRDLWGQLNTGSKVSRANLQYGDLVFFQNTYTAGLSHVGIYIGGGSFVHASSERTGVIVSSLGDSYWSARYYGASRP